MTATITILPTIRIDPHTLDGIEQFSISHAARQWEQSAVPHRTRPLLVVNNDRPRPALNRPCNPSAIRSIQS